MTMDFIIRKADSSDIGGIMELMEDARCNAEHPDWFVADNEDYVREHLTGKGFVITTCTSDGKTAGFFLVKEPEPDENLGMQLGFGAEKLSHVMIMDSAVVGSAWRGNGLQGKMLEKAEELIDKEKFFYLMCTIHPENRFSLYNMQKHGYEIKKTTECYGGLVRHILLKECR